MLAECSALGIIICGGWEKEGDHDIFIQSDVNLNMHIKAHDFGKIRKIDLIYMGKSVDRKEVIENLLKKIENKI